MYVCMYVCMAIFAYPVTGQYDVRIRLINIDLRSTNTAHMVQPLVFQKKKYIRQNVTHMKGSAIKPSGDMLRSPNDRVTSSVLARRL
jgi:hypothetical protein